MTSIGLWLTQPSFDMPLALLVLVLGGGGAALLTLSARALAKTDQADRAEPVPEHTRDVESPPVRVRPSSRPPNPTDHVDDLSALRHEFRTPLNAVLGFSDVLLGGIDGPMNESQQEDLEIIRASGLKLRILLDSALDLSELGASELKPDANRVDLRSVVERAVHEAEQLWAQKRTARCLVPEEACPLVVDESRVRRCIVVLADFLANQARDASIEFELTGSSQHFTLTISATPSDGLELQELPTAAEVLAAEDPMKVRQWPVAVVSEVVDVHSGSLYQGQNPARFVVRFPFDEAR